MHRVCNMSACIYQADIKSINAVRLLTRDEPAVFFSSSLVRPDQAAAPCTLPAGGCNYLRCATTPCERPASLPPPDHPHFSFFSCLSAGDFSIAPTTRNNDAVPIDCFRAHSAFVIRLSAVCVYSIHPFRCKVSYRLPCLKGRAEFRRWILKNLPFSGCPQNEYFFPKTLQTVRRNTCKAP